MNWMSSAEQVVEENTDSSVLSSKPVNKGVNKSYKVDTTDDNSFFVKFGTEAGKRIQTEAYVYNELSDKIRIPSLLDSGSIDNMFYLITEWIDKGSVNYEITDQSKTSISRQMGSILSDIHQTTVPIGAIGMGQTVDYKWNRFFRKWLIHNGEDVKKNYSDIGSDIMECVYNCDIPELTSSVISPMDYHYGNCIMQNGEVVSVIDFERCFGGHPMWSYAVSKRIIGINGDGKSFREGYSPDTRIDPVFKLAALCRELRMAHMIFDSPQDQRSSYVEEVELIRQRIF